MANLFFRTNVAPYRIDTYNALHDRMGFEFYFLYREDSSQNFNMQAMYNQCTFKPHFLKTKSFIKKHFKICTDIGQILKYHKPEIVIVPEFKILVLQVLIYKWLHRSSYKVISMCDDSYDMVVNNRDFSKVHKWGRQILTPVLDNLLLVDSRVQDWFVRNYKKGIWLPIIRDEKKEIPLYENVIPISEQFVKQFNISNEKILLYLGRLASVKNLERLMEAISMTKEEFTTVFVGDGELKDLLIQQAEQINKKIIFAGRYEGDDIRAWFNIADAFILPSYIEPFGAVTNEALLAGVPCLISENAGSASLINDTNGILINPYNIKKIAENIDKMMSLVPVRSKIRPRHSRMTLVFDEVINKVLNQIN